MNTARFARGALIDIHASGAGASGARNHKSKGGNDRANKAAYPALNNQLRPSE
jgi:hypothetical protein